MQIYTTVIQLQPGFYILRHPGGTMPPLSIAATPTSKGEIHTLTAQAHRGMILENAADCIVMRVDRAPVELLIAAYASQGAAVAPAMKVDRIALGNPAAPVAPTAPAASAAPQKQIVIKDKGISLVGHVELLGDVVAGEGETLGRPNTPQRVEGFQIMWPDRPEGVDIAYNVAVEGLGTSPVVKSGQFAGTRREAKRIVETTFALIGPNAAQYQLAGTAYFSGGYQIPVSSGAALSGPSGMEHLTGLSISVTPAVRRAVPKAGNVWEASARTKVFTAKTAGLKKDPDAAEVKRKPASKTASKSTTSSSASTSRKKKA